MKNAFTFLMLLLTAGVFHAQTTVSPAPVVSPATATAVNIGQSGNMFSCAYGAKAYLWADPFLKLLVFSHRGGTVTGDPTSRYIRYDVSTDGGFSWNVNVGPVYSDPTNYANICFSQSGIYNPPGNTLLDSAYLVYYAPFASPSPQSNFWWNGEAYGSSKITGPLNPVQHTDTFNAGFLGLTPEEMFMSQQNVVWMPDASYDSTFSMTYRDSIMLIKGVSDPVTHDYSYTHKTMYVPVVSSGSAYNGKAYADSRVVFAPDGQTGYFVVLGHHASTPAGNYLYPIVYKTTDGGATWSAPIQVPIGSAGTLLNYPSSAFTAGEQMDLVVDSLGNPHIFTSIGETNGNWLIDSTAGHWGLFDVYSTNGGGNWLMQLVAKPDRLHAYYGAANDITEDVRPQISMNQHGSKIFYTWFSTDVNLYPSATTNSSPDAFIKGQNIVSGLWTPTYNISDSVTGAQGQMLLANTSYYAVRGLNGGYYVPITYAEMTVPGDVMQTCQHKYLGNYSILDSAFTYTLNSVVSGMSPLQDAGGSGLGVVYPNPARNTICFDLHSEHDAQVSWSIMDISGRIVTQAKARPVSAGSSSMREDVSTLAPGVYFLRVQQDGQETVRRFVVAK